MKYIISVDNGTSGSIAILTYDGVCLFYNKTPTTISQDYTIKKQNVSRLDLDKLKEIIIMYIPKDSNVIVVMERPMINSFRFRPSLSAIRCYEAMLICFESFKYPVRIIDSKNWQTSLLPKDSKKEQLKKDSMDCGIKLFPKYKDFILKHKDADGLLIGEYARRNNF